MEPSSLNHSSGRRMVPPSTQPSPLRHQMHSNSVQPGATTTPCKNYGRIQQEVEREGLEVHKENLLSLSLSKREKPNGQNTDGAMSLVMLVGHEPVTSTAPQSGFSKVYDKEDIGGDKVYTAAFPHSCVQVGGNTKTSSPLRIHPTFEYAHVGLVFPSGDHGKRLKYTQENAFSGSLHVKKEEHYEQGAVSKNAIFCGHMGSSKKGAYLVNNNAHASSEEYTKAAFVACTMEETVNAARLKLFPPSINTQMPEALLTYSEGGPSLPLSLEISQKLASSHIQKTPVQEISHTDADWGKFLALSATPLQAATAGMLPFQQRFKQLQAYLKHCDETDPNECIQALRSLSAAARSGHAVELETRAIKLSLEEGKEMKRMRLLNVLGKISEHSVDDAGTTPQGPRLPAPGGGTSK